MTAKRKPRLSTESLAEIWRALEAEAERQQRELAQPGPKGGDS